MEKRIAVYKKLYPFYAAFTGDLLFFIAISSLFLSLTKGLSAAEIVSLASVSKIISIILTAPIKMLISKIGNTRSTRLGGLFLFLAAVFITAGPNYYYILAGYVFHCLSNTLRAANVVALENNLDMIGQGQEFINMRAAGNKGYSIITMLISFVASFMFNVNNYLPMFGCIACAGVGMVLSFFMVDYSPNDKITLSKKGKRVKIKYDRIILTALVAYGVFYSTVTNCQTDAKLFIQGELMSDFDVEKTALIIGGIVCISRIVRVVSNMLFARFYRCVKDKMGIILSVLFLSSVAFILFGSFMPAPILKIAAMALGYIIILFIRDPFRLYIQDVIFEATAREYHQTLLIIMELSVKIGAAGVSTLFTLILLKFPMLAVMVALLIITVVESAICVLLYRYILVSKKQK